MEQIYLNSENYELDIHYFEVQNPKAIIQIMHGMEEHQDRYNNFVKFLNDNGYSVYTANMRGHGNNAKKLGHFANKKGYKLLLSDAYNIINYIKERHNNTKIYLFAHSMGTIIARSFLKKNSKFYDKVILSGFPNPNFGAYFGIPLTNIISLFKGKDYRSSFIQNIAIGQFNKKISNPKTSFDWICYNENTISSYNKDPYCGFGFTLSAFNDLFHLVISLRKKGYKEVRNIPILMISGEDDPCCGGIKGRKKSIKYLKKFGFNNIKEIMYPNMRHEILNEVNNMIVYNDILDFINK